MLFSMVRMLLAEHRISTVTLVRDLLDFLPRFAG